MLALTAGFHAQRMQPFAQHRQVTLLRRIGYWIAVVALLPLQWQSPGWFGAFALGYLCCAPLLYEWLVQDQPHAQRALELLLALLLSCVILRLNPGLYVSGALLVTYLLCQLAEGGPRRALLALLPMAAVVVLMPAWVEQTTLAVLPSLDAVQWARGVCTILLVGMAFAFAHIGYARSVRLYRAKRALQQMNERLARYLPAELPARLHQAPAERLSIQRRWLTILFIDLCDFSSRVRQFQAEALTTVLDDYLTALHELCQNANGSLSKVVGDGALIVFELPHPGSQAQAVSGAMQLCHALPTRLRSLHSRWQRQGLLPELTFRAGIASGYCSIGDWGQQRLDYTVIGDAVNLASRLQEQAQPDTVLVDAASAALVSRHVQLSPPQMLRLKGFGLQQAFALIAAGSVDRTRHSAMVPTVSAVSAGKGSTGDAASERHHDREQLISAGLSRRAH